MFQMATTMKELKTESTTKLSNFNFQWTKTLPGQNNFLHSFLHFSRAKDVICNNTKFLMGARENKCQISQNDVLHMKSSLFNNFTCVRTILVKFAIHFLGLP